MVRAWTVRGGENGEREPTALDEGLIILGWEELSEDLSDAASPADLSALLHAAYPVMGPVRSIIGHISCGSSLR